MPREILRAIEAPNDGVRRLRELLRFQSAAQLALRIGSDPTAVRRWAHAKRTPTPQWRQQMETVLKIPVYAWEDDDALTTRRL
ncbi:MAG: hypothetical protein QOG85_5 [Gaiellaceae bacterium]|jgi:ribosome-binding protein aMBF1 (putative translation factor)|nr:hypothetical protein [Gaiellaceae bacterium]